MPHLLTQISAAAAGSLVAAIWEGLLLAGFVALALKLIPGVSASARSLVWTAALALVVLLPFLHSGRAGAAVVSAHGWRLDERLSLAVGLVWLALSAVRAAQLVRSGMYLRGLVRGARPMREYSHGRRDEAASNMGHPGVMLCTSDEVDRPSVVGFFRPRILLPSALLTEMSGEELAQIVLHEMEHLRRRDDWTNLAQKLALVVFPLNPALYWIERRLCLERELACDDRVLRATGARKAYAACLANLAGHTLVRRGVSLALGAWERQPELVRRVHRILFGTGREMNARQATFAVGTLLVALAAGADGLAHAPRLVSFGPVSLPADASAPTPMPRGSFGAHVQDVVFHPGTISRQANSGSRVSRDTAAEATTLRNDLSPSIARTQIRVRAKRRATTVRASLQPAQQPVQQPVLQPMVVLLSWHEIRTEDDTRDGLFVHRTQISYAAVPTRNGWLFFQL